MSSYANAHRQLQNSRNPSRLAYMVQPTEISSQNTKNRAPPIPRRKRGSTKSVCIPLDPKQFRPRHATKGATPQVGKGGSVWEKWPNGGRVPEINRLFVCHVCARHNKHWRKHLHSAALSGLCCICLGEKRNSCCALASLKSVECATYYSQRNGRALVQH